jgi:8-oxo-dGTP pyrophosphatase MutT (NUDIX family)
VSNYPHITVATVVKRGGKFLMVEERSGGELVYNQPAGHLELGETLLEAAMRETLEETRWQVDLTGFIGIYHFTSAANGITYVRHCFSAVAVTEFVSAQLDPDIEQALWLDLDQIKAAENRLRSPLVLNAIEDFLTKPLYPLSLLTCC